jgi:hypothetical protein
MDGRASTGEVLFLSHLTTLSDDNVLSFYRSAFVVPFVADVLRREWDDPSVRRDALKFYRRVIDLVGDVQRIGFTDVDEAKYNVICDETILVMLSPDTPPSTLELGLYILMKSWHHARPNFYDAIRVAMANDDVTSALKSDAVDEMYRNVTYGGGFALALKIVHAGLLPEIVKLFPQYPDTCVLALYTIANADTTDGSALVEPVRATGILRRIREFIRNTGSAPNGTERLLNAFAQRGQSRAVVESGCLDALLFVTASVRPSDPILQRVVNICVEVARNGYLDHLRASFTLRQVLAHLASAGTQEMAAAYRDAARVLGNDLIEQVNGELMPAGRPPETALAGGGRSRARARRSRTKMRRSRSQSRSRTKTRRSRSSARSRARTRRSRSHRPRPRRSRR